MPARSAWGRYLARARWYAGKGRSGQVTSLLPLPWFTPPGQWPAVRPEIAEVSYPDGSREDYQLLVAYLPAGSAPVDALVGTTGLPGLGRVDFLEATDHPGAMAACWRALLAGPPGMRWLDRTGLTAEADVARLAGEQSNTTLAVGDRALLKLFRRLEQGPNLDAEVLAALNGCGLTPRLYGVWSAPASALDLAIVSQRIPQVQDGWEYARAACAAGRDFSAEGHQLGSALRRLHSLLAEAFGTATSPGAELAAAMLARFAEAARQVPALAGFGPAAAQLLSGVGSGRVATQRIHGDFHLGQVLYRGGDEPWVIIDFEGEPLKSLEQRRAFDSVWRDVAGGLRSLDYARSAHREPDGAAARSWAARSRAAFLTGYAGADPVGAELLAAYEFDKAVYEVVYETRNRPDWVRIPLQAVQDEARRVSLESAESDKER